MSKLRLAYFSPLPPTPSGIADYSQQLVVALAQQAEVTLFVTDPHVVTADLQQQFDIQATHLFPEQRWVFDMAVYQMGNSLHHADIYKMALQYGGVVVLHDYGLHHFVIDHTADSYGLYARALSYAAGSEGWQTAVNIRAGRAAPPLYEWPLNGRLLDSSLGVIVHSNYVRELLQAQRPQLKTAVIPMIDLLDGQTTQSLRQQLALPAETTLFMSAGYMTPAMQLELSLRAFAKVRQVQPHVHYVLAGTADPQVNLPHLLDKLSLHNSVTMLGYIDHLETFSNWLATADVVVNLRYPTLGETSSIGMRALAAGRPLLVFDHGWYAELPNDACLKVPVMDEEALAQAMLTLAQNKTRRKAMGQAAVRHIQTYHRPQQVAAAYTNFITQILNDLSLKLQ